MTGWLYTFSKPNFGYCAESFFGGRNAEKQVVNGGDERGEFSFSLNLCHHATVFAQGFDG